ncbi:hypothetical protein B9081_014480 [Citrobacter werkmanii]|nr:hypothetical protein B9081_014480 [Citrobacter werkmanii]
MDGHGVLPNKSGCRVTFTAGGGEYLKSTFCRMRRQPPSGNRQGFNRRRQSSSPDRRERFRGIWHSCLSRFRTWSR